MTYVGGGGYADGGYSGGYIPGPPVNFVGPAPVSAPVGYPTYGFGRDYIGWRPYQPQRPVDCDCRPAPRPAHREDRYEGRYQERYEHYEQRGYEQGGYYEQQRAYAQAPIQVQGPPVYVAPQRIYVAPSQVNIAPPEIVTGPPVYIEQPPVYVQAPPVEIAPAQIHVAPPEVHAPPPVQDYYGDLPPPGYVAPQAPPRQHYAQEPGERG